MDTCRIITNAKKEGDTEYSSTVKKILGKVDAVLIDVMASLYSWGIIITYEVILNSLIFQYKSKGMPILLV